MDADNENRIKDLVKPEHWDEFVRFVGSGTASPGFLTYLDADPKCQEAVGLCLDAQGEVLRAAFAQMKPAEGQQQAQPAAQGGVPPSPRWSRWGAALTAALLLVGVGLMFNGLVSQNRIRHLETEVANRDDVVRSKEVETAALQEKQKQLLGELGNATKDAQNLRQAVSDRKTELDACAVRLAQAEADGKTQGARVDELGKMLKDLQETHGRLEKDYAAKEAEGVKLRAENERLAKQVAAGETSWLVTAAWCMTLRNEPLPNKVQAARGLLPDAVREKSPYLLIIRADLEGRSGEEIQKLLAAVKSEGFFGRLAAAEAAYLASGKPDALLALLAETEEAVVIPQSPGADWVRLVAERQMVREAVLRHARNGGKVLLPRLQEEVGKEGRSSMRTAAALVLADIGPEAKEALPALRSAAKTRNSYELEVFRYAIRKIGGADNAP